jgi:AraC-like DNA-binding protein
MRALLLSLLLFFNLTLLQAQQHPATIPYQSEIQVDGDTTEWDLTTAFRFDLLLDPAVPAAYNNIAVTRFAWDEQYLYLIMKVSDSFLCKQETGTDNPRLNLGDAMELYIDPQGEGGHRMDVNDYQIILDAGNDYCVLKGDKHLIEDPEKTAPKEPGISTLALLSATRISGTLNRNEDQDQGWIAELAIPWAGIGIKPQAGVKVNLDVCLNDLDTTADLQPIEGHIPSFNYVNWSGEKDFSYPDHWVTLTLEGGPTTLQRISRRYSFTWLLLFILTGVITIALTIFFTLRIRQLKNVPVRAQLQSQQWIPFVSQIVESPTEAQPFPSAAPAPDPLFEKARAIVISQLDTDLKPSTLAHELGMSLRTLQLNFKERMNTTPGQFITVIKMEQATQLLLHSQKNINEIAWALGFTDPGYFSRVFRKYFGKSPREVRQVD